MAMSSEAIKPFCVDKVKTCTSLLQPVSDYMPSTKQLLQHELGHKVEAVGFGSFPVVKISEKHGFLEALRIAFDRHYPISLAPSHIWLLIIQGIAEHVELNAERLRNIFVDHDSKVKIKVRRDDFVKGFPQNNWPEVFEEFSIKIQKKTKGALARQITQPFSSTSAVEKAAFEVTLLHTMKSYFELEFLTMCGFPKIYLEGTVSDWQDLQRRVQLLKSIDKENEHFQKWIKEVDTQTKEFVNAAEGRPNIKHWKNFFKLNSASGGPYVSGWINSFFPYVEKRPNYEAINWQRYLKDCKTMFGKKRTTLVDGGGSPYYKLPAGLSTASFNWLHVNDNYKMKFVAGFLGVEQIPETFAIRPSVGWVVMETVLDLDTT